MAVYLIVSTSLVILGLGFDAFKSTAELNNYKKPPNYLYIIPSFMLLFFISAFRGDFTIDYKNYAELYHLYNNYCFWDVFQAGFNQEVGYLFLNQFIGLFTNNVIYLFAFISFITLFGFYYHFNKYSSNLWLSVLMFVTAGSYYASFNISRLIFAVAIIFIGSKFLYERKFFKFVLIVVLAALFHKSALVMIPFYFILNFRINFRNWVFIAIGSSIVMVFFDDILSFLQGLGIYDNYTEYAYGMWGQSLENLVLPLAFLIFCLLNLKKLDPKNNVHRIWFNSVVFYAFFNILALQIEMVERFGRYFAPYALLLIPYIFSKMKNKHLRVIYMMGLIFILILYNYIVFKDSLYDPYYFIWDK